MSDRCLLQVLSGPDNQFCITGSRLRAANVCPKRLSQFSPGQILEHCRAKIPLRIQFEADAPKCLTELRDGLSAWAIRGAHSKATTRSNLTDKQGDESRSFV